MLAISFLQKVDNQWWLRALHSQRQGRRTGSWLHLYCSWVYPAWYGHGQWGTLHLYGPYPTHPALGWNCQSQGQNCCEFLFRTENNSKVSWKFDICLSRMLSTYSLDPGSKPCVAILDGSFILCQKWHSGFLKGFRFENRVLWPIKFFWSQVL